MDKGLNEEKIAEITNYEVSKTLTRKEKLALKFAEKMGIEHKSVDDEFFELLKTEFSQPEIVEMSIVISVCIGWGRLLSVFKSEDPHSPEEANHSYLSKEKNK